MENQKYGSSDSNNRENQKNEVGSTHRNTRESTNTEEQKETPTNSDFREGSNPSTTKTNTSYTSSSNKNGESEMVSEEPELYSPDGNKADNPNAHKEENREDSGDEFDENTNNNEEFLEKDQKRERQNPDSGNATL